MQDDLAPPFMPHDEAPLPEDHSEDKPTIRVKQGILDIIADQAEAALNVSANPIFQRGTSLVVPVAYEVPTSHGRMTVAPGLKIMCRAGILDYLYKTIYFEKFNAKEKKCVNCDPPKELPGIILSRSGLWRFPVIAGVISTPTLRPDGSILATPGYDPITRLYHYPDPHFTLPPIPSEPTQEDAIEARDLLRGLLAEFPFVSAQDRVVAMSCLMTPVLRGALPFVPIHVASASTAGTGKTYLVDVASTICTGRPCPVMSVGEEQAETDKRIDGLLLRGGAMISIDNVNGILNSSRLCQATTSLTVQIRVLGGSDLEDVESRATIFVTGNGVRLHSDLTRRGLFCAMDAGVERPELRQFQQDPCAEVMEDRGRYVAAVLTIARAYIAAGMPGRLPPLASFAAWSDLVRSALVWVGEDDPALTMEEARERDPDLAEVRAVIHAWHTELGPGEFTLSTVKLKIAEKNASDWGEPSDLARPRLHEALLEIGGSGVGSRKELDTKRAGKWLSAKAGRVVDGLRIVKGKANRDGIVKWSVEAA